MNATFAKILSPLSAFKKPRTESSLDRVYDHAQPACQKPQSAMIEQSRRDVLSAQARHAMTGNRAKLPSIYKEARATTHGILSRGQG